MCVCGGVSTVRLDRVTVLLVESVVRIGSEWRVGMFETTRRNGVAMEKRERERETDTLLFCVRLAFGSCAVIETI